MDIRAYVAKRQVPTPGKCFSLEYSFVRETVTWENSKYLVTLPLVSPLNKLVKWSLRNERRNSIQMTGHHPSSETQGQSVGPGEKARRKISSTGGKAPGYRLSPDHFQTVKRILAPDWAQEMRCIIVPNRRTASPEFFSWIHTRRLLGTLRSSDATATRTSLKKWIWVLAVFIAIIPTHLLCQM